ncbi:CHAT domain-containing protein [Longimicrobium sp.]|uniref:CHAT domain-containing protein n=1 Tax=Longimicrobium sp. TaxID=2029185 RepID=UPI002D7F15B9|nr:CHAT domain-containing protein [Longimicrobium sp.]
MMDKIKVLFLASDPFRDRAPLRLDEEVRAMDHAIRKGSARDRVELVACFATRRRDLQDALLRHDPQIVHFAGHGGGTGVLYLGDEHGRPRPVGKEALAKLFGILRECIRVVFLNGCDTLPIVEALGEVVDYAIGMNRPLTDPSAVVFAQAFYGALAMGQTVQASFELAISQLELEGNVEAAIPVLRVRPGVDPAVPLVTPPAEARLPDGGSAQPADARQVNVFETFRGDDALFEVAPGSGNEKQENRFGNASGNRFTFRAGGSR